MEPVKSTAEVLVFKVLNRDIDKTWVNWAVDMLMAGFETEHLLILAGESEPFNQFEMQELTNKVLNELGLDYSDKEQKIKDYVCFLVDKAFNKETGFFEILNILKNLYNECDYQFLYDFFSLYFAKDDLEYSEMQWYWKGATRKNIDDIIVDYFIEWKVNYCVN